MSPISRLMFLLLIAALAAGIASAQGPTTGTPPFGSFGGGPDIINLANLNSHIAIPVIHKPGRGTFNFTYDLSYDSSVWYPVGASGSQTWQYVNNWGWRGQTEVATGYITYSVTHTTCLVDPGPPRQYDIKTHYTGWTYHDPFGVPHYMRIVVVDDAGCLIQGDPYSGNATAADSSGYSMSADASPSATVTSSAGKIIGAPLLSSAGAGMATDRNGNQISVSTGGVFTDTLGMTALTVTGGAPNPLVFTYTTPAGGPAAYTMRYSTYTVQTAFGCSGISEYPPTSTSLVSEIDLPDGSKYTFAYEQTPGVPANVTGRLKSVTLPTGGTITYAYSGGSNGITCADGSTATLTRATPDGTWIYAQVKGTGAASTTTITDPTTPTANQTVIQFQGIYETQRTIYQGSTSGTLLQTVNTCYNTAVSPCTTTAITLPINQRTTLATVPGPGNLIAQRTDKFDSFGNSTEADDYDFATAAPFPLLRQTLISYAALGGNLNAFRQTVTVKDGAGNIKSRQDTNYDQYSSFTGANCITGAPKHDDAGHGCTFTARANATSVTTYTDPVTPGGAITKNFTFDSLGNLRTAQLNCCQVKTWSYSTTTGYAYPDSTTSGSSAPQVTTSATYDLNTGLVLTTTDPNNVQTTLTYDNLGRPLTAKTSTNPTTNYTYTDPNDGITNWTVKVCSPIQGTNTVCNKTILDSLGRTKTTQLLDGNSNLYSAMDTQYDTFGRTYKTSNPYTGSSPSYWTQLAFDTLGRPITTTLPDNSISTISYTDNTATTTDPALVQRKSVADGLGRLTSVYEPDPSNGNTLILQTSYTYNVFDELTQVTQAVQTRSYVYDALGRLSSATTPETGTVCFGNVSGGTCYANGYDLFDNLLYKTDARGVVTNYQYDSLNRRIGVSYTIPGGSGVAAMPNVCTPSGGTAANVCLAYGTSAASFNNGLLISMTDPSGSESYTYDQFGNVTQLAKAIGTNTYTTNYAYNLANELTQIQYPSGRIVQQSVDAIGRLCEVAPSTTGCATATSPFATGFGYNAASQVTGFKHGNGVFASSGFSSDRLQLNCLDYSTTIRNGTCSHDSTTKFGLNYSYGTSGSNNGLIGSITDYVDNGRSATYTYDALYRLTRAVTAGSTGFPAWGLSESYDRYGNRSAQGVYSGCTGITCPTNSVTISTATNRISNSPYTYDLSGNMTNDGQNTLVYDGENRAVSATVTGSSSGTYAYDGNGMRIQKVSVINGTTTTTVYVFSSSKVVAEYDNGASPSTPTREYIYAGGALLAKIDSSGTKYYHHDHLSNRLVTDSSGNTVAQMGQFPFGESWYNASNDKLLFTAYERDSESGNDYAMARYYVNRVGRFSSPDSVAGVISNPQSLNRYAYVLNNPINLIDPFGLDPCDDWLWGATSGAGSCWLGGGGSGGGGVGGGGLAPECNLDGVVTPCDIAQAGSRFCPPGGCFQTSPTGYVYAFFPGTDYFVRPGGAVDSSGDEEGLGLSSAGDPNALAPTPQSSSGGGGSPYANIRETIRTIFQSNQDCADLFGGTDKAISTLDKMNIVDLPTTPYVITNGWNQAAWNLVAKNINAAATAFDFPRGRRIGWNGGNYNTYVGTEFASYSPEAQTAVMMHEMAHPTTGYPSDYANGVIDQPSSPYSPQSLFDNCVHK